MDAKPVVLDPPANFSDSQLKQYANIDNLADQYQKSYQYIRRSCKPVGFFIHTALILKLYHMERENEPLPRSLVEGLNAFIEEEVERGSIDPKQAIGFAILSQGFLSINIWGRGNVLFTQTYTVEGSFPNLTQKTLERTGVACTWEIRIMNYEYEQWQKYLESPMTLSDKKAYFCQFISGQLY